MNNKIKIFIDDFICGGVTYMSNNININANFLKVTDSKTQGIISYKKENNVKVAGTESGNKSEKTAKDTILNISQESRLKSAYYAESKKNIKKSGITSAREAWENDAVELKQDARGNRGNVGPDYEEIMRIESPEMYAKYQEFFQKAVEYGFNSEKGEDFLRKSSSVVCDFMILRASKNHNLQKRQYATLDALDAIYSDETHDTSFNYYSEGILDEKSSLWRFKSKFNVLLTVDMLETLATSGKDKEAQEKRESLFGKIHSAVTKMKEAEKNYEGDLTYLRFGVKLWDDGNVTYHANYKGCEEKEGITANSAEELLEKLMSKTK